MTIENKELNKLLAAACVTNKYEPYGLYIEGYSGGATVYAFSGKYLFKKSFTGNNKRIFRAYIGISVDKKGFYDIGEHCHNSELGASMIDKFKIFFEKESIGGFSLCGENFFKAVKLLKNANKETKCKRICFSIHDGILDLAAWQNDMYSCAWNEFAQADCNIEGAFDISAKCLDGLKTKNDICVSFLKKDNRVAMCMKNSEGVEACFAPYVYDENDKDCFENVLGYEYNELKIAEKEKPACEKIESAAELKPAAPRSAAAAKPIRAPKRKAPNGKPNGAFTGWQSNRLGTKQIKVLHW